MSDHQIVHDPVRETESADAKWVPIASADEIAQARRFGILLENADIPYIVDEQRALPDAAAKAGAVSLCVQDAHYERACEIIAIDHAELSDMRSDDDDDDFYDDDDDDDEDPDGDLDDDDDDVFFDDDDDLDDDFDDDDDDDYDDD